MADFVGTTGDDSITGTASSDSFDLSQGGHDTVVGGGGGEDDYHFGGALDSGDMVVGSADTVDLVWLDGDYSAGVTLSVGQFQDVDQLLLHFGAAYRITLTDGVGGVNGQLNLDTGSTVRLDASAVTQTAVALVAAGNGQTFMGGAGDDVMQIQAAVDHSNRLDGGAGDNDELILFSTQNDVVLKAANMQNFETLNFQGSVATSDANVAAGQVLKVYAGIGGAIDFDGHRETDGAFLMSASGFDDVLIGGRGADSFFGLGGEDVITGGKGADTIWGGAGADAFVYTALSDSTSRVFDVINDLDASDLIDLSGIDARTDKAGNQAFKLVDHFDHQAGELTVTYKGKDGFTVVAGDVDGDGKADLVIHLAGDHTGFEGFVL